MNGFNPRSTQLQEDRCGCGQPQPCEGLPDTDNETWPPDDPPTSLDTIETSGRGPSTHADPLLRSDASPAEKMEYCDESHSVRFRHSGWLPLRRRVQAALVRTGAALDRRLRFMGCGSTYHVLQSTTEPGRYKLCANACHDRFCLPCANERARIVAHNVHTYLAGSDTRFITLTLRSDQEPLAELLNKLYESFKALRKLPLWRKTQTGGVAFLEVKWNSKTTRWHPHFHVLSQGSYLNQAKLSTAWKAVTKGSWVCDIRAVEQEEHAVAYCTKYASKPFDREMLTDADRLDEAITALTGRRMILTFGKWKGLRVTARPDPDAWEHVGTVAELARKAVTGDKEAMQILVQVLGQNAIPFLQDASAHDPWQPPTGISWAEQYFIAPTNDLPS